METIVEAHICGIDPECFEARALSNVTSPKMEREIRDDRYYVEKSVNKMMKFSCLCHLVSSRVKVLNLALWVQTTLST